MRRTNRDFFPLFLLFLLFACAPTQAAVRGHYLGFQGTAQAGVYGSLDGVGVSASSEGRVLLFYGSVPIWTHDLAAGLARGYRIVATDDGLDLVALACREAVEFWPVLGPCETEKSAESGVERSGVGRSEVVCTVPKNEPGYCAPR